MIQVKHMITPTIHIMEPIKKISGVVNWHLNQYVKKKTITPLTIEMAPIRLYAKYKVKEYYDAIQTYKRLKEELNI